jgi:hypothetical protein
MHKSAAAAAKAAAQPWIACPSFTSELRK